jgi:hypothetical protein
VPLSLAAVARQIDALSLIDGGKGPARPRR